MTLWVKNLYTELLVGVLNGESERTLQAFHQKWARHLRMSMVECRFCGYLVEMNEENEFYDSYEDLLAGRAQYSILRDKYCQYCYINQKYFREEMSQVSLEKKGKQRVIVSRSYARHMAKTDWWYDKAHGFYTDYVFENPAFNQRYKGSVRFWRTPKREEVYGHEFEMRFASCADKLNFAQAIKDNYLPCITEKDGSLDGGIVDGPSLELITPPWSYEESLKNVEGILKLADKARPMDNGYAWHITVNLLNADNPARAGQRLMELFNAVELREFWQQIARRPSVANPNGRNYCKFEDKPTIDTWAWEGRWAANPVDHYYATFLRKCGTAVEIRLLKSTVDFPTFCATLEIIRAAWSWAKGDGNFVNWESDLLTLSENTQKYIEDRRKVKIEVEVPPVNKELAEYEFKAPSKASGRRIPKGVSEKVNLTLYLFTTNIIGASPLS